MGIKVHEQSSTETVVGTKSVNLDSQKTKTDKVDNERPSKKALKKPKIVRNQKCKVTCGICGCLFLYKSNLKRHINLVHLKLKPFQCEICLKYFAEKKVLHKHKIKFHGEMAENDKVDTERLTKKSLEEAKIVKKTCDHCGFLFASKANVRRHFEAVHLKLKPWQCEKCTRCFATKGEMTDHFKKAHLRLKAPKFEKNLSNTVEMKKCNDLVDFKLKPFQCEICETRFSKKDLLKRHIDGIHSELKPFQCKECNLSFPQKRRLQRHINGVHLKLRPFQCQMCRNWYSRRDEVKRHIETVHLKTKPHKPSGRRKKRLQIHDDEGYLKTKLINFLHKCKMSEAKFEKVISEDTIEERKHLKAQLIDFLHKSKLAEENFEKFVSTETKEKPLKKKYKPGLSNTKRAIVILHKLKLAEANLEKGLSADTIKEPLKKKLKLSNTKRGIVTRSKKRNPGNEKV